MNGIKAKCRHCNCETPTEQLKLHFELRQMVCPSCFSGKTKKLQELAEKEKKQQPPGWDEEDEYLERSRNCRKQEQKGEFSRISGSDKVKYTCHQCNFSFKHDPFKRIPRSCPYCNCSIPKVKTFNLL